jgi:hypothetical protein
MWQSQIPSPFPSSQEHAVVLNIVARRLTDADREFQAYLEQERRMDRKQVGVRKTCRSPVRIRDP